MVVCRCLPCISSPVNTQKYHKVTAWSTMCVYLAQSSSCCTEMQCVTRQCSNQLLQNDTDPVCGADSIPLRVSVGSSQHKSVFIVKLLQVVHVKSIRPKIMHVLSAKCKLHPRNYSRSMVQATRRWLHSGDTSHVKSQVPSWASRQV